MEELYMANNKEWAVGLDIIKSVVDNAQDSGNFEQLTSLLFTADTTIVRSIVPDVFIGVQSLFDNIDNYNKRVDSLVTDIESRCRQIALADSSEEGDRVARIWKKFMMAASAVTHPEDARSIMLHLASDYYKFERAADHTIFRILLNMTVLLYSRFMGYTIEPIIAVIREKQTGKIIRPCSDKEENLDFMLKVINIDSRPFENTPIVVPNREEYLRKQTIRKFVDYDKTILLSDVQYDIEDENRLGSNALRDKFDMHYYDASERKKLVEKKVAYVIYYLWSRLTFTGTGMDFHVGDTSFFNALRLLARLDNVVENNYLCPQTPTKEERYRYMKVISHCEWLFGKLKGVIINDGVISLEKDRLLTYYNKIKNTEYRAIFEVALAKACWDNYIPVVTLKELTGITY